MAEELVEMAKQIVVGVRQAEELARQGKAEEAEKTLKELKKAAKEKGLYKSYASLFRKVEGLIGA